MEDCDYTDNFVKNLFEYLTNKQCAIEDIHVFRKHNNKLDISGDISFPLNYSAWKKYVSDERNEFPILKHICTESNNSEIFQGLLDHSKNWIISINKCIVEHGKLNIFLNRTVTFKTIITQILSQQKNYGRSNLPYKYQITICTESENKEKNLSEIDLTELRMVLLKNVLKNLLQITGNNETNDNFEIIYITNKSKSLIESKKIVCGVVTSNKYGKKYTDITALEYYDKRTVDMQLIAQHKYGVRVNSESGWKDFLKNLGFAAVAIDLLHVKPSRPIVINVEIPVSPHSKGASFILYNCARLSTILKQFDHKVSTGAYPPLPKLNEIDFTLLNQPEEWEILYVYLMQYPQTIKNCVKDIMDCKINVHYLCTFLDSLCSIFSAYYRRVRILTDPRVHLFPVLQARIYLLKAIQEVFHNTLALLNIPPVKQM